MAEEVPQLSVFNWKLIKYGSLQLYKMMAGLLLAIIEIVQKSTRGCIEELSILDLN